MFTRALLISTFLFNFSALAKETKPKPAPKAKKVSERYDPVPGGARADFHFSQEWDDMVKHQKFPTMVKGFDVSDEEKDKPTDDRKRYIFYLGTSDLILSSLKYNEMDDGYYRVTHKSKEFGTMVLVFHPKYRKCFENVTAKFEQMQWVALLNDRIDDPEGKGPSIAEIILERPRQCLGTFKSTGSKLPSAKSDITSGN
jgi:hypothetical protein